MNTTSKNCAQQRARGHCQVQVYVSFRFLTRFFTADNDRDVPFMFFGIVENLCHNFFYCNLIPNPVARFDVPLKIQNELIPILPFATIKAKYFSQQQTSYTQIFLDKYLLYIFMKSSEAANKEQSKTERLCAKFTTVLQV